MIIIKEQGYHLEYECPWEGLKESTWDWIERGNGERK